MRKWIFVAVLLAAVVGLAFAGEGDRRYDNIQTKVVAKGVNTLFTPTKTVWRYDIVYTGGTTADQTSTVTLYKSATDTTTVTFTSASTVNTFLRVPFYGPPVIKYRISTGAGAGTSILIIAWY